MGRLTETLEASGELDNTVFVVMSDHGYFYGEHGLSAERRLAYEETIRIPLLVRYPPMITAGSTPGEFALTVDLAPTLIELAGTESSVLLDGRSLIPVFTGQADGWRNSFLIEYFSDTVFERIVNMGYQAVRTERFKYIHYLELDGMDELYDLEMDPDWRRSLASRAPEDSPPSADRSRSFAWRSGGGFLLAGQDDLGGHVDLGRPPPT